MGMVELIALSMGVAWASGINLYATLAMLGILGASGGMVLPDGLGILAHPAVIVAAGFMYCVEFFADKTPGVDSGWDAIHAFVRIPAGAALAAGALGQISPEAQVAAAILGGGLAATSYTLKAGSRVLINTSPEPVSNWTASLAEDVAVVGGLWIAIAHPVTFFVLLAAFVLVAIWALPKLWSALAAIVRRIRAVFGRRDAPASPSLRSLFDPRGLDPDRARLRPPAP